MDKLIIHCFREPLKAADWETDNDKEKVLVTTAHKRYRTL